MLLQYVTFYGQLDIALQESKGIHILSTLTSFKVSTN